ncbi:nitric oxide synthase oxygenase [Nocardia fluminea]|uniref:nitric oxide synthase oxygenase n=1 Tax=Nocardia fluminea TaxID=134984 RepID=UPI00340DB060
MSATVNSTARQHNSDDLERRIRECVDFFDQPELTHISVERRSAAQHQLRTTGTYQHTLEELRIGAQLAWRNSDRCVGRKHRRSLDLIDARAVSTALTWHRCAGSPFAAPRTRVLFVR